MSTSLLRAHKELELAKNEAAFVELQVHDKFRHNILAANSFKYSEPFQGYLTIHGEGETDGKRKINFSSISKAIRENYVKECADLYCFVSDCFNKQKMSRIILHPGTYSAKLTRTQQLILLADSLLRLSEKVDGIDYICIEPRGGDRQGKILRIEIGDIEVLWNYLDSYGIKNIGLCIDIAQLFIVHGHNSMANFLIELKSVKIPVKEFHVSDVLQNSKVKNRVAMEVGTGAVDWRLLLPLMLEHCNDLLIETLGGVKVFQRSKAFLESILKENNMT